MKKISKEQQQKVNKAASANQNTMNPEFFSAEKINEFLAKDEQLIDRRVRCTAEQFDDAGNRLQRARIAFNDILNKFHQDVSNLELSVKKGSGGIRESLDKISQSLQRLSKNNDLDKIERAAKSLTEMANALERLSKLNESGKLEGVINAIR